MNDKVSASLVKELREKTGAGMMDCKKALFSSGGDLNKATDWLRQRGISIADGKASRPTNEGVITSYVHTGGKLAVLIEVTCETDFVERSDIFKELSRNLAMQVAACPSVKYVSSGDVPQSVIDHESKIEMGKDDLLNKKEDIRKRIVEGRISKRVKEMCLFDQPFLRDSSYTVGEMLKKAAGLVGENIQVRRFVRLSFGGELDAPSSSF